MLLAYGALLECFLEIVGQGLPPDLEAEELVQFACLSMSKLAMISANGVKKLGDGNYGTRFPSSSLRKMTTFL